MSAEKIIDLTCYESLNEEEDDEGREIGGLGYENLSGDPISMDEGWLEEEIYHHHREMEKTITLPMTRGEHRGEVINWLFDTDIGSPIIHMVISYLDRYLLYADHIDKKVLRLVCVASMFIARKYEGYNRPTLMRLCEIIGDDRKENIISMEMSVLKTMGYQVDYPRTEFFLRTSTSNREADLAIAAGDRGKLSAGRSLKDKCVTSHLLRIAQEDVQEYDQLQRWTCYLTACIMFLSRLHLQPEKHPWNAALVHNSGYESSDNDMKACVSLLRQLQSGIRVVSLDQVNMKYNDDQLRGIAQPQPEIPAEYFQVI